jgi:2-dehydro-3-deoxyglucarate aldolase
MIPFKHQASRLKQRLQKKELTVGSWLTIPHRSVVEVFAKSGFEWLVIDLEHAPIGIDQTAELIAHIQGNGMQALVRVTKNEEVIIKRVLDAGVDGIVVPMVKNKQEAENAVAHTYYPPRGNRGVGLNRAQHYGEGFESYKKWLNDNIVIIAQIEHIDAIENLDEILSVEGIDGTIIGPYDLSGSMGFPGDYNRPDVKDALQSYKTKVNEANKPLGYHVIESDASFSIEKIQQGYSLIAFSIDFFFLGDRAKLELKKIKKHK